MSLFVRRLLLGLLFSTSVLFASTITVGGTSVTFERPEGFEPLSEEIIAYKWPSNQAPSFVVGNETASTTIAYDYKNSVIGVTLEDLQQQMTATFDRVIPGIEWIKNEIIELDDQEWIMLEMTSNAIDADIYNILLFTELDGKLLMFNFNSVKSEFSQYEDVLRQSIESIRMNR